MEPPKLTRQRGFNYSEEQVVNELEEVNLEDEIVYRSVPILTKTKSEEYDNNCIKVNRSYSY